MYILKILAIGLGSLGFLSGLAGLLLYGREAYQTKKSQGKIPAGLIVAIVFCLLGTVVNGCLLRFNYRTLQHERSTISPPLPPPSEQGYQVIV